MRSGLSARPRGVVIIAALTFLLAGVSGKAAADHASPQVRAAAKVEAKPSPIVRALNRLELRAEQRFPGSFAGLWGNGRGKVVLAFTSKPIRRVKRLRARFPRLEELRARKVERSLRELEELQEQMIADRTLGTIDLAYDLDIDVRRNAPVVVVEDPSPSETDFFKDRYGGFVIVRDEPIADPDACHSLDPRGACGPELRSGLKSFIPISGGFSRCTTAFTVTRKGTGPGILSAAHCGDPDPDLGEDRYNAMSTSLTRLRYGGVIEERQSERLDVELHDVDAPFKSQQPWLFVSAAQQSEPVHLVAKSNWTHVGITTICKSGSTTGESCGKVTSTSYSPSYIPNGHDFIRASYCAENGDSGAGVYSRFAFFINGNKISFTAAYGVHSGGPDAYGCPNQGKDYGIFSHIDYINDELPIAVRTS